MCGLTGILLCTGEPGRVDPGLLERMRDRMADRGPDGSGLWLADDGRIGLAHRRLAIVDPAPAAAQPMASADGRFHLVFNGEIYNHAELRRELQRAGVGPWRTDHSDAEVLLYLLANEGLEALHRLRGMFAFALWDARERTLHLVRDRFGIKPLYWLRHGGRLAFASTASALLVDPRVPRRFNVEMLPAYLAFLCTPAPDTLFAGISKLAAGTRLEVRMDGSQRLIRWYDPWERVVPLSGSNATDAAEQLRAAVADAVASHAVADVPVGVFLSGGLDSSINARYFNRLRPADAPAASFALGWQGDAASCGGDELPFARIAANHAGTSHHELCLSEDDLFAALPRLARLQDEPIADPVCLPVLLLSDLARRQGVPVVQVGEGADEIFCGYPAWRTALRLQAWDRLPVPRAVKRLGAAALSALRPGSRAAEFLRRAGAGQPVFWSGAEGFAPAGLRPLLSSSLRRHIGPGDAWRSLAPIRERFLTNARDPSPLHWMMASDLALRLPELLLMRLDKMCMGASVEGRVPFLDHRLVELALSLPSHLHTDGPQTKPMLRHAVGNDLPASLMARRKQGFGVPIAEWLRRGRLGAFARAEVLSFCRESGLLDEAACTRALDRPRGGQVWCLLDLAMWWREHIRG
ncbi:MAG: asparagine synthase (glutamine-hydrolyzing) [Planctomycetota bacterium]